MRRIRGERWSTIFPQAGKMKASLAFVLALVLLVLPASGSAFEKIASAGGDITEILFEIGVGDRVVAVDNTSIYPNSVRDLKQIGYVRDLSAEGVLSTGADILIGAHDMGSPAVMDNLAAAGMTVAFAPEGAGVSRYEEKVRFIGEQLGLEEQADAMINASYD
ncbi:MAG: ABC transporter substrate-binding protein, partial [Rhodobacteraceae bacterium]|nr:ABC transporter substrate-binding protein [Paracoccaceae bacterium]